MNNESRYSVDPLPEQQENNALSRPLLVMQAEAYSVINYRGKYMHDDCLVKAFLAGSAACEANMKARITAGLSKLTKKNPENDGTNTNNPADTQ